MSRRRYSPGRDYERTYNRTLARRDAHRRSDRIDRRYEWRRTVLRSLFFSRYGVFSWGLALFLAGTGFCLEYKQKGLSQMFTDGGVITWILVATGLYIAIRTVYYILKVFDRW